MKNLLKFDFWHEEAAIGIMTLIYIGVFVWTYIVGSDAMFSYLTHYTSMYIPAVLIFGGLKVVDKKMKNNSE